MDHHLSGANDRTSNAPWQDLPKELWPNILSKAGTESLLLSVPLVCTAWYKASLTPSFWTRLVFETQKGTVIHPWTFPVSSSSSSDEDDDDSSSFDYFIRKYAREFGIEWRRFSISKLIKFAVNRSRGGTQFLKVPGICSHYMNVMSNVLEHIGRNCSGFEGLHMTHASVDAELAEDIVRHVPKIKYLCLRKGKIGKSELIELIKGCKELEVLDVRGCVGFSQRDREIAEVGAHIKEFLMEGSSLFTPREWEIAGVVQVDEE